MNTTNWNDWHWQVKNRITTVEQLSKVISIDDNIKQSINLVSQDLRWAISPYYANLMDKEDLNCPIRRQAIPDVRELTDSLGVTDPKKEEKSLPVSCLFQLYPDRLVFYLTNRCPTFCRHCFRKRRIGKSDTDTSKIEIDKAIKYLSGATEIRDVLITGGDAFMVSNERIDYVLYKLRKIAHIEIIRFGTRTLCTLPQRVTVELAKIIAKYHPIWINTQFNHPREITEEAANACDILLRQGIPIGNQTVLLRGINDEVNIMKKLVHKLLTIRVRPYYIFHGHFVKGTSHFRTSLEKGTEIIKGLQGYTTGFAVPRYVISTRIGKIPLAPNYIVAKNANHWLLKNYEDKIIQVPREIFEE